MAANQLTTPIYLARAHFLEGKAEELIAELYVSGRLAEDGLEHLALRGDPGCWIGAV